MSVISAETDESADLSTVQKGKLENGPLPPGSRHHALFVPYGEQQPPASAGGILQYNGLAGDTADCWALNCEGDEGRAVVSGRPWLTGRLLVWSNQTGVPKIEMERLQWTPAVEAEGLPAERYWLGIDPDHRPSPDMLARPKMIDGMPVKLGDGRFWCLPRLDAFPLKCRPVDNSWALSITRIRGGLRRHRRWPTRDRSAQNGRRTLR